MSSSGRMLGLPPISPQLKSISAFLQRAEELKSKEPVMAYWCAYHAAQVGISLKAKDATSRNILFELLGALETMKKDIGPNDAIDIESASSAYVENFALKVFTMADNEDRRGDSTRSTAKKFLAAANFLEVLKVFPKAEVSESTEEKIRYAKWKAADIAKAFREGRKPTPGPPGSEFDPSPPQPQAPLPPFVSTDTSSSTTLSSSLPKPSSSPPKPSFPTSSSPPKSSLTSSPPLPPPQIKRSSPPPHMDPHDIARANQPQTPRKYGGGNIPTLDAGSLGVPWDEPDLTSPGNWSTAATPGTAIGSPYGLSPSPYAAGEPPLGPGASYGWGLDSPVAGQDGRNREKRSGSGSSSGSGDGGRGILKKAWVSEELEGSGPFGAGSPGFADAREKGVRFTPSVVGGVSAAAGSPPVSPLLDSGSAPGWDIVGQPGSEQAGYYAASLPSASAPFPPSSPYSITAGQLPVSQDADVTQGQGQAHTGWGPQPPFPPPPAQTFYSPTAPAYHPPPLAQYPPSPTLHSLPLPPTVPISHAPAPIPPPLRQPEKEQAVELTAALIAKAQKHCRFAISALDYEDAEQAKRELRAALAVLGG